MRSPADRWASARHLFGARTYHYPVTWWRRWLIGLAWMLHLPLGGWLLWKLAPHSQVD